MRKCFLSLVVAALTLSAWAAEMPASGTNEVFFSPWDDAEGALLREIGRARHSIHVQAYLLTSRNIARALQSAHGHGVRVSLLADREMVAKGDASLVPQLALAGIPVRLETRYALAHNKIMLIDAEEERPVIMTGSYNFTFSAQARNAENLLILRGNRTLMQTYLANWRRHWDEAQPFGGEGLP